MPFAFDLINGDVEGRTAVGGSVFASSFGFGTRITCGATQASQATLIATGSAVTVNGEIQCGNLVTPTTTVVAPGLSFRNGRAITGDVLSLTGLDFAAVGASLSSASSTLCSSAGAIPATIGAGNRVTFTATNAQSQPIIFSITADQLASATAFTFNVGNPGATVVVNVLGGSSVTFSNFDAALNGLVSGRLTYNICSATTVNIAGFNFMGNLLAPLSDVTITRGQITGLVAARTLTSPVGGNSGEVHLPNCPAT